MKQVFVLLFGDSIVGRIVQDTPGGRYRHLAPLKQIQENEIQLNLDNWGRFGCTIGKAERLIERQLANETPCQAMLLEYGGNDCNYKWREVGEDPTAEHQPGTPLHIFRETYLRIVRRLMERGILPVIMNLPPIDAEKFFDTWIAGLSNASGILEWLGDKQMIYRWHERYSLESEAVARETGAVLIDVRKPFLERHSFKDLIGPDGIHPTEQGHDLIIRTIKDFLFRRGYTHPQLRLLSGSAE
jgi:acyl-CoA thioesterase-1